MGKHTTVSIYPKTEDKLQSLLGYRETYDSGMNRILDEYERLTKEGS